jgi:hypothetical protein
VLAGGYSATANHNKLLTTPDRGYSGDATRQDDSTLLTVFGIVVRQDRMLSMSQKSTFATPSQWYPSYCIGSQPLRGHLSDPISLCNCPALCYKRTVQPPKATTLMKANGKSHNKFTQAQEHSFSHTIIQLR